MDQCICNPYAERNVERLPNCPIHGVHAPQPQPTPNESRPIWEMVIEDMRERDRFGREKYKTPLQVGNGRRTLLDAYQEALDLCVYLRLEIEERRLNSPLPPYQGLSNA